MKKILVVDDTKTWLCFHTGLLKEFYGNDVQIVTADCARHALKILHEDTENLFDVIITDMQMEQSYFPMLAGEWLIENIKMTEKYKDTPVIIISAVHNLIALAKKLHTECIPKSKLYANPLLLKYMIEKLTIKQ